MNAADPEDGRARLLGLINANWSTQAIRTACALGLPERLAHGAVGVAALAAATGCHPPSLRRLLRALVTLEVCSEHDDDTFGLAALGELLREDDPQSLRAWAWLVGGPHWARWGELEASVRTGESHRHRHEGHDGFEHLGGDRAAAALFHRAMVEVTRGVAADVTAAIELGAARLVVDVGGGHGELLATLLAAHPATRGVLFDLPHAIDAAPAALEHAGVADRCECVAGSFFDAVPVGGDLYLLKSVLHNWDDARCIELLHQCRRAMPTHARLLVVERVVPERPGTAPRDRAVARSDLNMLVALSGRERRITEFEALLEAAGMRLGRVVSNPSEFKVIEGLPC